ncbi:hypothetical protein EES46_27885 [Streptomyces sp. ADI98-10]|nr:hypothetical protein EES46_27885 [Streptomyces sp. ADI98-10]
MVCREPELPPQRPESAAQGVAHYADQRGRPVEGSEPVWRGGGDHLVPLGPGLHVCRTGEGVDGDRVHPAGGDEDPAGRGRGYAVAGRLDGDGEPLLGGEGHRGGHVLGRQGGDDHVGPVLRDAVEAREFPCVPRVLRGEGLTPEPGEKPVQGFPGDACMFRWSS